MSGPLLVQVTDEAATTQILKRHYHIYVSEQEHFEKLNHSGLFKLIMLIMYKNIVWVILYLYDYSRSSMLKYSSPSLSSHSQERPPSLMWPQSFGAAIMNAFSPPSHQRPPL